MAFSFVLFLFSNAYEDIIPGGVLCCPDGMLCIFFSMYNEILTFYPIIFTDESEVFSKVSSRIIIVSGKVLS